MPISTSYETLLRVALKEFADIVVYGEIRRLSTGDPHKLRLHLIDESFIEIYLSPSGRYSYHWERRVAGRQDIYRHDNAPHKAWRHVATFPKHFHNGTENQVIASDLSPIPSEAVRQFCLFVRRKLRDEGMQKLASS